MCKKRSRSFRKWWGWFCACAYRDTIVKNTVKRFLQFLAWKQNEILLNFSSTISKKNNDYIYKYIVASVLLTLSWILTFSWPLFRLGARRTLLVTGGSIMMIDVALSSGVHPWWKLDSLTSCSAIKKTNIFFNLWKQYFFFFLRNKYNYFCLQLYIEIFNTFTRRYNKLYINEDLIFIRKIIN